MVQYKLYEGPLRHWIWWPQHESHRDTGVAQLAHPEGGALHTTTSLGNIQIGIQRSTNTVLEKTRLVGRLDYSA
jgi:hypothetical protein